MDAAEILKATPDDLITKDDPTTCSISPSRELSRQKDITTNSKERLCESVKGAIGDLNKVVGALSSQAKLGTDTQHINSMLYNSLILLIDELDYIAEYIERVESQIDTAVFDIAKKLNESIVHLIGHRKDILFKIIETTYKIHDYIIKQKRIVNDTAKLDDALGDDSPKDWIEE